MVIKRKTTYLKKIVISCLAAVFGIAFVGTMGLTAFAANNNSNGFDQYGYNNTARIFNGTASSWCLAGGQAADGMGIYSNDKLIMKWNAAWDACNATGTATACNGAWTDNEWNGKVPGGSGQNWHYKIVWVGDYTTDPSLIPAGGYGVWGQYAVLMDQGQDPNVGPGHMWFAHATPTGYGVFKQ